VVAAVKQATIWAKLEWRETNFLLLERGPYVIAAGLDESIAGRPKQLRGRFVNLFDPELRVLEELQIEPGNRYFLRDLDATHGPEPQVLASAGKALVTAQSANSLSMVVEGVGHTPAVILLHAAKAPRAITLAGQALASFEYSAKNKLLWIRFENDSAPRNLAVAFQE
jgi:hypothetical protein